jgi:hypothetical protein
MKKQLLIAAVAATMGTAAIADISIAGAAKINYTTTSYDNNADSQNAFKNEADIKITGKNGDTTVVMNFANDSTGAGSFVAEDNYVATSVEGVSLKAGNWDNGNNELRSSTRGTNKLAASTTMGGITVSYSGSTSAGSVNESVTVAGEMSGVKASYEDTDSGETVKLSTSVAGLSVSYLAIQADAANKDRNVITVSGKAGNVGIKVAKASADSSATISGDTWMGDYEGNTSGAYMLSAGQDVTAVELSGSMAGNSVKFRNVRIDDVAGEDTSFNKFIVTRPLANGTTFEAVYTALDDDGSTTTDSNTLDLELAVKF